MDGKNDTRSVCVCLCVRERERERGRETWGVREISTLFGDRSRSGDPIGSKTAGPESKIIKQ
jgi:hypothetical protein